MSIPPLVCSTPPPLNQCEDDRHAEDFDIHYNLSQDDEDDSNDYNYGTYSDYIYPTSTSRNLQEEWSPDISKKSENKLPNNVLKEKTDSIHALSENESSIVNKIGYEDTVIEDLNLKVEDENDVVSSEQSIDMCDKESSRIESLNKDTHTLIPVLTVIDKNEDEETSVVTPEFVLANSVIDDEKLFEENVQPYIEETVLVKGNQTLLNEDIIGREQVIENKKLDETCLDVSEPSTSVNTNQSKYTFNENDTNQLESKLELDDTKELQDKSEYIVEDFGDFDDFQFIATENNPTHTIEYCDNPWDGEVSRDSEFGDFTANFDDENDLHIKKDYIDENKTEIKKQNTPTVDTDDFGDFDDFKSSLNDHENDRTAKSVTSQNVPVFSLYSPDSEVQIIESINTVLNSIFTSEVAEVENDFDSKLESLLNETWGHLVDTDVRQPYIVHWNNSLGQKSLLKALCIDSRNILFGPKWHIGMPKYAANLNVAPLQPQKPFTQTNTTNTEDHNADRSTSKETGNWMDPFTSNGQEYTYAEALLLDLEHLMATLDQMAHKHSTFKISELLTHACNTEGGTSATTRPTNLDVFTNVTSPEMNKIYSTTLSAQPIRQINLPDTHIFTPTDSETPRSKTIHYDAGLSVLVPQRTEDETKEVRSQPKSKVPSNNSENDEDYWEFQDFKGPISNKIAISSESQDNKSNDNTTNNSSIPITVDYQTQILQPIKVEPIMPALNWPAPGEVKGAFDDFSDFVSNSSWNDNMNVVNQTNSQLINKQENEPMSKSETLDDDFETFQSAPTVKSVLPTESNVQSTVNINHHNFNDFPHNSMNPNEISSTTHSKTDHFNTVQKKESTSNSSTNKNTSIKSSPVLGSANQNISTLLQPSMASTSGSQQSHKKTGQILQPLSLEGYSQINWPNPGIDLQDLSRFNPVESLQSLKTDSSAGGSSKLASPAHKDINTARNETSDDDIWGDFVSSKPKQQQSQVKKLPVFADDDEWTDFVSSPSVKPQNGLNTISLNVHTNLNMQKSSGQNKYPSKSNQISFDIPTLNYVTPKSSNRGLYNEKHFQNL